MNHNFIYRKAIAGAIRVPMLAVLILFSLVCRAQFIDTSGYRHELGKEWKATGIKAVAYGFVTKEGQHFTEAFGPAVFSEDAGLTANHIFRIASMTKAITSVAAMQLVERGLLNLDDTVSKLLPAIGQVPILKEDGSLTTPLLPVTLRHLLTHTSGFGYSFFNPTLGNFKKPDDWPYEDFPRLHEAGVSWLYGTSTDWVGRIVETVSGQTLEAYIRDHITGPLKMNHTWFNVPEHLAPLIVSLGMRNSEAGGAVEELPGRIPEQHVEDYSGGGGLFSSLNDYLRFLECMLHGGRLNRVRILKQETVKLLFEDQLPGLIGPGTFSHGLAWAIETQGNQFGRREGSGYWSGAYNTFYSIDTHTGVAVVVMTNMLPFGDKEAVDLYKQFELRVRSQK